MERVRGELPEVCSISLSVFLAARLLRVVQAAWQSIREEQGDSPPTANHVDCIPAVA